MYTIKDVVSDKFILLNEFDLINVEGVKSITQRLVAGKQKQIIVGIGLYDYLFNPVYKNLIREKTKRDFGYSFNFVYGVNFS